MPRSSSLLEAKALQSSWTITFQRLAGAATSRVRTSAVSWKLQNANARTDGNGWWDEAFGYNDDTSKYFNTGNWEKALTAVSTFSKSYPNVVGMSLRNELRPNVIQDNKSDWYKFVTRGANAIHAQNSDLLIVIGGTRSAADLRNLFDNPLDVSGWKDRTVWEFHAYWWTYPIVSGWCPFFNSATGFYAGFLLEQGKAYTGPLWLSEFGVGLQGGPHDGISDVEDSYLNCLTGYMQSNDAECKCLGSPSIMAFGNIC